MAYSMRFSLPGRTSTPPADRARKKSGQPVSTGRPLVRLQGMEATIPNPITTPKTTRTVDKKLWTARVLGSLVALFLIVDAAGKILRLAPYVEGTAKVGYSDSVLVPLGL